MPPSRTSTPANEVRPSPWVETALLAFWGGGAGARFVGRGVLASALDGVEAREGF